MDLKSAPLRPLKQVSSLFSKIVLEILVESLRVLLSLLLFRLNISVPLGLESSLLSWQVSY